jgi:hypothetical protein
MKRLIELMLGPDPFTDPLYEHGRCEPQGCIIVQRYIDAHASAVMAPGVYDAETGEHTQGYIVMGRDNDGVTAALDGHKIVLPVSGKGAYVRNMWKTLGLDPAVHEVEFVSNLYDTYSNMVEKNNPKALFKTMHTKNFVETRNHIVQLRGCAGHEPSHILTVTRHRTPPLKRVPTRFLTSSLKLKLVTHGLNLRRVGLSTTHHSKQNLTTLLSTSSSIVRV